MENTVAERISLLRNFLNLKQEEFAERLGLSQTGVQKMESPGSNPRKSSLLSMCRVFGVNREWLLDGIGEMKFEKQTEPQSGQINWKDEAFEASKKQISHLEKEVQFLRDMLLSLTGKMKEANFLEAFSGAGNLSIVGESVRVAA